MSQPLHRLFKFAGMLTVLLSTTWYSASKASAQSLLPDVNLFEGGQICLALCTSPRSTSPATSALSNQGLGALPAQVMQLPNQVLQLPQQILSPQGSSGLRPNLPAAPGSGLTLPPGNLPTLQGSPTPAMLPGNPAVIPPSNLQAIPQSVPQSVPQSIQPAASQGSRPGFLQKIAPVLPVMIQQLSK